MSSFVRYLVVLLALGLITGCYNQPVRHLASDVSLITVGQSTKNDVLTYLGDPDEVEVLSPGVEKWFYKEYEKSSLKEAPLVGKYFGAPDYGTITVIIKDETVVQCVYGAYDVDGENWTDDFDWQQKKP